MNELVPSHHLNHKIPFDLLIRVDEYVIKEGKHSRTEAINELIQIGLIVNKNKKTLEDPQMVTELYSQLKEGGAVDYIQRLGHKEFEILHSIIENEHKDRQTKLL